MVKTISTVNLECWCIMKQYQLHAHIHVNTTTHIQNFNLPITYFPDGKMWFDSFDCASWVLRAFQEFGKLGVKFDQTVKLNYTHINLFSDMPKYLGNQSMVFANKTLGKDIMKFYSKFQAHVAGPLLIEHLISALEEILIQNKFYIFYNEEYWFLPMKSPHVKLTYNEIPLPS